MESIMQYVWQHRLWMSEDMVTNDGRRVRVIDPGLLNTNQGPDFFNAKIEIEGQLWVGNIEIHVRATDWRRHQHNNDPAYYNVVLHVVEKDDAPVYRPNGELIPQVVLQVSPQFTTKLNSLLNSRTDIACATHISTVPHITLTEWIQALAFERLHSKVGRIAHLYNLTHGNWEEVCYITLSRNLGFGINNDAMERLARITPLRLLHKHSDSLLQVEALLYGQAGFLHDTNCDAYSTQLMREYTFLANKFTLSPMEQMAWKTFRMRPPNFPARRIALMAHFVHNGFNLMQAILEATNEKSLRALFTVELTGYWATHYSLGKESNLTTKAMSDASIDIILINTVAPLYYAYGDITGNFEYQDRAIALLEALPPERNSIIKAFGVAGIKSDDALTTQALLQLKREYCDARKCIYCKIGHRLLASHCSIK